jgi:hypothetical protein
MRKFQTSVAVGFFMGSVCAASQMFLLLFFLILGYIDDRVANGYGVNGERFTSFICFVQAVLLGAFAATLAAHRSEILDQKISIESTAGGGEDDGTYDAPKPVV